MNEYIADFHVHTALSPCCNNLMTPKTIIEAANTIGVKIIAISDHNAGDNVLVMERLAEAAGIKLFYSLELHVLESFHMLTLFEERKCYMEWLGIVEQRRSKQPLETGVGKAQRIFNEHDEIISTVAERLNVDSSIPVREAIATIHELGGICIASHIDRAYDSVLRAFGGEIPEDLEFDALEISSETFMPDALIKYAGLRSRYPFVANSDSHIPAEFILGPKTVFHINEPTLNEVLLALNNRAGRKVEFKSREW
ncbi:MAG: PHP domain-containing protein [Negativicutes bacterium]|jgi:hypothetical protein